ncbi:hypothetical protein FUAX_15560 [Fulvitalea axinellae]|uniref:CysZ protein n=1 Tax=Fulvitalea axinellae TaxID=1182444 RepID=A0AAU9D3W1_9BACT|nr:hypothetical protein FUAX_15560 [Fulvitalea axinellae]
MRDFLKAVYAYKRAYIFLKGNRLGSWLVWPALANLILFVGLGVGAWFTSGTIVDYFLSLWDVDLSEVWSGYVHLFLVFFARITTAFIYLKLYRYIMLILFAPILAIQAEKFQRVIYGGSEKFVFSSFIKEAKRGVVVSVRNLFMELAWTLGLLVLSFAVPILSPVFAVMIFVTESYYFGFSMLDYSWILARMSPKQSYSYIKSRRGLAVGNGMIFNLLLLVPLFGALFGPALALAAALLSLDDNAKAKSHTEVYERETIY